MKNLIIVLGLILSINSIAQSDKIKINLCEQMFYKNSELIKLRIVHLGDTFFVPQINENTFLNPIAFYDLDTRDTSNYVQMIIENYKYRYTFYVDNFVFYAKGLDICLRKGKY